MLEELNISSEKKRDVVLQKLVNYHTQNIYSVNIVLAKEVELVKTKNLIKRCFTILLEGKHTS